MLMVIFMRVTGLTIRQMVTEPIHTQMVQNMLDNGRMINNMVKVLKLGQMVLDMKVNILMERNMEVVRYSLLMDLGTKDSFPTMIYKVKAFIYGLMKENMMENGLKIKCMAKVKQHGQTIEDMRESIRMIKNTGRVILNGLMVESILDSGKMGSSMV